MRGFSVLSIALLSCLVSLQTHAFQGTRGEWWGLRRAFLEGEADRLFKGGKSGPVYDQGLKKLLAEEAARAGEMAGIMAGAVSEDGSPAKGAAPVSGDTRAATVQKEAGPIAALAFLNDVAGDYDTAQALSATRQAARVALEELISGKSGTGKGELAARIFAGALSVREWKDLSREVRLGVLIESRKARQERLFKLVEEDVSAEISRRGEGLTGHELGKIIRTKARARMTDIPLEMKGPAVMAALRQAGGWQVLARALDREIEGHRALEELAAGTGIQPARTAEYARNPELLDSTIFGEAACGDDAAAERAFSGGGRRLPVPHKTHFREACREIDRMRRHSLSALTGREKEDYFRETGDRYAAVIDRHARDAEKSFRLGNEMIGNSVKDHYANEKEFLDEEALFRERLTRAREYVKKSLRFLRWASRRKSVNGEEVLSLCEARARSNGRYLDFFREALRAAAAGGRPEMTEEIRNAVNKSEWLYAFAADLNVQEGRVAPYLEKTQVLTLREMKAKALRECAVTRAEAGKYLRGHDAARVREAGRAQKLERRIEAALAQQDLDMLIKSVEEQATYYDRLTYAGNALSEYGTAYTRFVAEVKGGSVSRDIENALRGGSLIAVLPAFDRARLDRECLTRRYLKKEAEAGLIRYTSQSGYYRRRNIGPLRLKSSEELAALARRFERKSEVPVGPWKMNESNYAEIDRDAASALAAMFRRSAVSEKLSYGRDLKKIVIDGVRDGKGVLPDISFELPGGWTENDSGGADRRRGVVRYFTGGQDGSSVSIVRRPLSAGGLEEAAGEWIRYRQFEPVEKRWEKRNDIEFLRVLSRDRKNNVTEVYAARRGDYAILISGNASRNAYLRLRKCLSRIVESVKI